MMMGTAFFTTDELAAAMQMDVDDVDDNVATLLAQLASDIIRDDLGGAGDFQQIDFIANDTVTIYGDSGQIIVLPQKPVTTVTSIVILGRTLNPNEYNWRENGRVYRVVFSGTEYADMQTWIWPFGVPITITYSHGYTTLPNTLKQIAIELAVAAYTNPSMVVSQAAGPYMTSYIPRGDFPGMSLSDEQKDRMSAWRVMDM